MRHRTEEDHPPGVEALNDLLHDAGDPIPHRLGSGFDLVVMLLACALHGHFGSLRRPNRSRPTARTYSSLDRTEGSRPVGAPDEELGADLFWTSRLLVHNFGVDREPTRVDLHPADVVTVM
jgi:hypothetical protein